MRILKAVGLVITILIAIIAIVLGYIYYEYWARFPVNEEAYPHRIGYITPEEGESPEGFKLCNESFQAGWHNSAAPKIYKGTKYAFREMIAKNYKNRNYDDDGFLNLRFHINCEGQVGNLIINEINKDYEPTNLNVEMVKQLVTLSIIKDNWNKVILQEEPRDIYMYLIFKIENGEVSEILP